jgi:hypothetical protein
MVRRIRQRWRTRIAIRGAAIILGAGLVAFLVSVYGLEFFRFSASSVVAFRAVLWVVMAGLTVRYLVWPLTRRVSDEQAALYLEENEPSLEAAVLGALETGVAGSFNSEALEERLVESALHRAQKVDFGRRIEQRGLYKASGALAGIVFATLALLLLGPAQLRHGASALLFPTRDAGAVNPYSILVEPGDVTIARSSDQIIAAQLQGFENEAVQVFFKSESSEAFDRLSMLPDGGDGFELLLLSVDQNTEYFVESAGIRSATFEIEVADLPYVDRLELEYRFPSYTGLPPRTVEVGGDIAALKGTTVTLRVSPTMLTPGGRLLVDSQPVELVDEGDGTLTGSLTVQTDGYYHIELARADGSLVPASPQYTIDVLTDQPPSVSFSKPGRDTRASTIEELFLEAKADDDFGVAELLLIYSVNGGPADTISMFDGRSVPEVTAGHTLYLEEFGLEPGDLVSYYAQVNDNNRAPESRAVTSDIYFVKIRPFRIDYRQGEEAGGGGGGGGGGGPADEGLSELQKEVVAATFNIMRDRERYGELEFQENLVSVRLGQARVREQVEGLLQRLLARGMASDPQFERIAELLPKAVEEMKAAEVSLEAAEPESALPPEQRALLNLQKAEETYEAVVSQGGQGGGGGGASAEDLADLFELELDKLKNQYETVQRGERREASEQLEETLEQLKELARRQQQEAERQRRASAQQGGAGGSASRSQRQLADETEEAARQLERLAREINDQQLMEAAGEIQDAANDMRRSAASNGSSSGSADAGSALDRLEEARRRLERDRVSRLREDAEEALRRTQDLAAEQREIQDQMARLGEEGGGDVREAARRLFERKEAMAEELADLESQIDRLSSDARSDQRETSDRLKEAANSIRDNKLKERVRYSRGLIGTRDQDYTGEFEAETTRAVDELQQRLEEAVEAVGNSPENQRAEALDRVRDLTRGVESLSRRLDEHRDRGAGGQENQQGQGQGQGGGEQGEGQGQGQGEGQGQGQGEGQGQGQGEGQGQGQGGGQGGEGGRRLDGGGVGSPRGGNASSRPGAMAPGDIRQTRREVQERIREAVDLQRLLQEEELNTEQLNDVIAALRALDRDRVYTDVGEVARLQSQIIEGLKQLEFGLRRESEGNDRDRVFLSGSDEVPTGFRRLVEEYYKALSRQPGG